MLSPDIFDSLKILLAFKERIVCYITLEDLPGCTSLWRSRSDIHMVQLRTLDFNRDKQWSLTIEWSTNHFLTQTFRHTLSSSVYFLVHVSRCFSILGPSETHHTGKVLKQCYSNFLIAISILVKLYFFFSLHELVPNSIMGQVRCIPKLSTV